MLGYYETEEEAARAYDRRARSMRKPLNFPEEVREQVGRRPSQVIPPVIEHLTP